MDELIYPFSDKMEEECGVFGVYSAIKKDVSAVAYYGLCALQHRGQESAGITTYDNAKVETYKDTGLVASVFDDEDIARLKGNIAISVDRVKENAKEFSSSFDDELRRVMIHGLLHFMGYNDSTDDEIKVIRAKEEKMLRLFHVKQ